MKTQAILVVLLVVGVFLVECIPLLEEEIDNGEFFGVTYFSLITDLISVVISYRYLVSVELYCVSEIKNLRGIVVIG